MAEAVPELLGRVDQIPQLVPERVGIESDVHHPLVDRRVVGGLDAQAVAVAQPRVAHQQGLAQGRARAAVVWQRTDVCLHDQRGFAVARAKHHLGVVDAQHGRPAGRTGAGLEQGVDAVGDRVGVFWRHEVVPVKRVLSSVAQGLALAVLKIRELRARWIGGQGFISGKSCVRQERLRDRREAGLESVPVVARCR